MKLFVLVLSLVFSLTVQAKEAGDDVVVEVPSELVKSVTLKVTGQLSESQKNERIKLGRVEMGADNIPVVNSYKFITKFDVNQEVKLLPGYYYMHFAGGTTPITLFKPDSTQTIALRKIRIPKGNGDSKFSIFVDYTNDENQYRSATGFWVANNSDFCTLAKLSSNTNPHLAKEFCINRDENRFDRHLDFAKKHFFDEKGRINTIDTQGKLNYPEYEYVIKEAQEGEYVSVLPGVYGITFKGAEGFEKTKLGVVVK